MTPEATEAKVRERADWGTVAQAVRPRTDAQEVCLKAVRYVREGSSARWTAESMPAVAKDTFFMRFDSAARSSSNEGKCAYSGCPYPVKASNPKRVRSSSLSPAIDERQASNHQ